MKLVFRTLEINNFMSYKHEVFDFSAHKGLSLICGRNNDIHQGKNGAGKSNIFAALVFVLFGQTPNKIKTENISNRLLPLKEPTSLVLDFSSDGIDYKIEAGLRNKSKNAYCNVYRKVGDGYENITLSSILETRRYIEKEIIRCDLSIFLRTVILSSDQTYNFFRLRAAEKRDFIEKLFDISVFGQMHAAIHRDVLDIDKQVFGLENSLMTLHKTKTDYEREMEVYQTNKVSEKKTLEGDYENLTKQLNEAQSNKCDISASALETKLTAFSDAYDKISDALDAVSAKINSLVSAKIKYTSLIESNRKITSSHSVVLSKLCPSCTKVYANHYELPKMMADSKKYQDKVDDIAAKLAELNKKNEILIEKRTKVKSGMTTIRSDIAELVKKINAQKELISSLTRKLDVCKNSIAQISAGLEYNPYIKLIDTNLSDIAKTNSDLDILTQKSKYLKFAENLVSQDTLKKFIIKDLVVVLNKKIRYYLNKLGASFTCVFNENMDYEFVTESGSAEFDNFSSGEKMRLTIATSLAFRDFMATRSNLTSNILILDEFIDSNVDKLAIDGIVEILNEFIALYKQNIYVVSHRKEISNDIFDNIIIVEKTNGISKIIYENP